MGTVVEFQLLVLHSLRMESPINRSAKAVISRNITTTRQIHLFIFLFIHYLLFSFHFYFTFYKFTENKHYRLICIAIATDVIGWRECIKKYVFII